MQVAGRAATVKVRPERHDRILLPHMGEATPECTCQRHLQQQVSEVMVLSTQAAAAAAAVMVTALLLRVARQAATNISPPVPVAPESFGSFTQYKDK